MPHRRSFCVVAVIIYLFCLKLHFCDVRRARLSWSRLVSPYTCESTLPIRGSTLTVVTGCFLIQWRHASASGCAETGSATRAAARRVDTCSVHMAWLGQLVCPTRTSSSGAPHIEKRRRCRFRVPYRVESARTIRALCPGFVAFDSG